MCLCFVQWWWQKENIKTKDFFCDATCCCCTFVIRIPNYTKIRIDYAAGWLVFFCKYTWDLEFRVREEERKDGMWQLHVRFLIPTPYLQKKMLEF